jgi:polyisoprenoid-binding protein YceI
MKTWVIDTAHSTIGFKIKHLMVSTVRGHFKEFDGSIESANDSFDGAIAKFTAQIASIDTNQAMRDGHLRSSELFDAEKFPTMSFVSEGAVVTGDRLDIAGMLTLRGVTNRISFHALFEGYATDAQGDRVASFDLNGTINRSDFGLTWNKVLEAGGVAVGEEVTLEIHVLLKEVKA